MRGKQASNTRIWMEKNGIFQGLKSFFQCDFSFDLLDDFIFFYFSKLRNSRREFHGWLSARWMGENAAVFPNLLENFWSINFQKACDGMENFLGLFRPRLWWC